MAMFDQRYSGVLPALFYGTGKLTADKPIVATVNFVTNYDPNRGEYASVYRAFASTNGGTRVFLPTLKKNAVDTNIGASFSSGIAGRLIGSSATTVTLTYHLASGTLQRTQSVSPSSPIISFDQRYDAGLADGSSISGVLTTNPPQLIVATVSLTASGDVSGDATMTYEGIPQ